MSWYYHDETTFEWSMPIYIIQTDHGTSETWIFWNLKETVELRIISEFLLLSFESRKNASHHSSYFWSSQYALLLSYFQYCQHMLDPDVSATILHFSSANEQDNDLDLQKVLQFQFFLP